jgi:translation initiation factor IF-2
MHRLVTVFCISLTMLSAFGQSTPKYQVGTIIDVKTHQHAGGGTDKVAYDVSVKVGDTIYVVLYTPPLGEETVKYALGRDLLVLVGKHTLRYNDILGQSYEVPIESQLNAKLKPTRPASSPTE